MKTFLRRPALIATPLILLLIAVGWQWIQTRAQGSSDCSAAYTIDETLPGGGRWEMCWEHRNLDGIVLRDITYTTPDGIRHQILSEASISQVHVPYDDNTARYHDITDDGFGGNNMADLTPAECPDGTLLTHANKRVLCKQRQSRGYVFRGPDEQRQGNWLRLFSVSTSGEYNYVPEWRFYDNGTIEPLMGATGKLQRFGTSAQYGWPVRSNTVVGISHIHNYYWRLDFDIGEEGADDIVEEISLQNDALAVSRLESEAGRSMAPDQMRTWRIRDGAIQNGGGNHIAYELTPRLTSHRDEGPSYEPWTHNDFYATTYRSCERYVSHNPAFNQCGTDVSKFVNGESLLEADVVIWYGVTFHHLPRDEDEPYMHTHWDGFQILPMNWTQQNSLAYELPCQEGDVNCDGRLDAVDALFILQHTRGSRPLSDLDPLPQGTLYGPACDVDNDGSCGLGDHQLLLECSTQIANAFCSLPE